VLIFVCYVTLAPRDLGITENFQFLQCTVDTSSQVPEMHYTGIILIGNPKASGTMLQIVCI